MSQRCLYRQVILASANRDRFDPKSPLYRLVNTLRTSRFLSARVEEVVWQAYDLRQGGPLVFPILTAGLIPSLRSLELYDRHMPVRLGSPLSPVAFTRPFFSSLTTFKGLTELRLICTGISFAELVKILHCVPTLQCLVMNFIWRHVRPLPWRCYSGTRIPQKLHRLHLAADTMTSLWRAPASAEIWMLLTLLVPTLTHLILHFNRLNRLSGEFFAQTSSFLPSKLDFANMKSLTIISEEPLWRSFDLIQFPRTSTRVFSFLSLNPDRYHITLGHSVLTIACVFQWPECPSQSYGIPPEAYPKSDICRTFHARWLEWSVRHAHAVFSVKIGLIEPGSPLPTEEDPSTWRLQSSTSLSPDRPTYTKMDECLGKSIPRAFVREIGEGPHLIVSPWTCLL
ncbi:hypothetical protein C8Q76DRAFT_753014, partial [Earliella scabrosa]